MSTESADKLTELAEATDFVPAEVVTIETQDLRYLRFCAKLILRGLTSVEIRRALEKQFDLSTSHSTRVLNEVKLRAKLANSDEDAKEVIVAELVRNALQRARMFHQEAIAPPPDEPLTPQGAIAINRLRVEADKAARANAAFVLDVYGRTSARWSPKTVLDAAPLEGGTSEERAAVRKLMGLPPLIEGPTE